MENWAKLFIVFLSVGINLLTVHPAAKRVGGSEGHVLIDVVPEYTLKLCAEYLDFDMK